jgi:hypothetical protein
VITREALAILILPFAAWLPGALAVSLWGKRLRDDPLEFLFAGLAFGVLIVGWLALVLAELGYFSLGRLAALWGLLVLVLGWQWRQRVRFRSASSATWRFNRWEAAALALWLVVASWLFFRPHEFVAGGADAGVYISLGANIAKTGAILIHDPLLAALDPSLYPALLREMPPGEVAPFYLLPGFYIPDASAGLVIPQFYPLHPVWQAIAFAVGGLRVELLMTPLWGLLGALTVYFTVRRLWGWQVGLLTVGALSLSALQAWFARYPTAEMLTQYLLWTGVWALVAWVEGRSPQGLWAALAGGALGQVFLVRIDMYALLVLPVFVGYWLWRTHGWQRQRLWFFGLFGLFAGHSLAHGALLSSPYFYGLLGYSVRLMRQFWIPGAGLLGLTVVIFLMGVWRPALRQRLFSAIAARRQLWVTIAAILLLGVAFYGYFLRPHWSQVKTFAYWYGGGAIPNLDHENLLRLGWYLGPGGIALGVAGACWLLIKGLNRRTVFMWGIGIFFSLLYLWRIQANPHQIYTMRRYVPVVLPFFIIAAAYLIHWLNFNLMGKKRWLVSAGLTVVWLSGIVWGARGFVSQVDYRGMVGQLDRFAVTLPPHSVLIFGDNAPVGVGDGLGTPLRFIYSHDVLTLRNSETLNREAFAETIRGWQRAGRRVYWAAVPERSAWPLADAMLGPATEHRFETLILEHAYDHKPTLIIAEKWQFAISEINADW